MSSGQIARVADERTREALEAIRSQIFVNMDAMRAHMITNYDELAKEVRALARLQGEHTVECTEIRRADSQRWESLNATFAKISKNFEDHCGADAVFQKDSQERFDVFVSDQRKDQSAVRLWIWGALLSVIAISWGIIGWLGSIALHAH